MSDSFTEVTTQSWFSRIKDSIKGILAGILMILIGIGLLFWNEGRTVKQKRALEEGQGIVMSVDASQVNADNDGKLIHISGEAVTEEVLQDPQFGISENAIHLSRRVEMYQWKEDQKSEKKKKLGGSEETVTTYTYNKEWSSSVNNSSSFKKPEGHENPTSKLYDDFSVSAVKVHVGGFELPSSLINMIGGNTPIQIEGVVDPASIENALISNNTLYIGSGNIQNPEVGDCRITFSVVKPKQVSIVGKQTGNSLESYITSNDRGILLLESGNVSAENMFKNALSSNSTLGWILRLVGIVLIVFGFVALFKPLSVLADVVPFIGNIVGFGTGILAFILGISISLLTIAIAWIFYRPWVGIPLLIISVGLIVFFIRKGMQKRRAVG